MKRRARHTHKHTQKLCVRCDALSTVQLGTLCYVLRATTTHTHQIAHRDRFALVCVRFNSNTQKRIVNFPFGSHFSLIVDVEHIRRKNRITPLVRLTPLSRRVFTNNLHNLSRFSLAIVYWRDSQRILCTAFWLFQHIFFYIQISANVIFIICKSEILFEDEKKKMKRRNSNQKYQLLLHNNINSDEIKCFYCWPKLNRFLRLVVDSHHFLYSICTHRPSIAKYIFYTRKIVSIKARFLTIPYPWERHKQVKDQEKRRKRQFEDRKYRKRFVSHI